MAEQLDAFRRLSEVYSLLDFLFTLEYVQLGL
jgi:hypothetical protein